MYLAYARHDRAIAARPVLATARALLDAGADPNAGYLWHGLPSPFTVLTGAFGEGEQGPVDQPRHPHAIALARLLLEAGADPNDSQALYNRMFERDDDHLELLFEFGLGTGDGGPWRARLGHAMQSPTEMVDAQLWWAVEHDMAERVRLLVAHGADPTASVRRGRTAVEAAAVAGNTRIVDLLVAGGATPPDLRPVDQLIGALAAADRDRVAALTAGDPTLLDAARAARPSLLVDAVAAGRRAAVELLLERGFDVNAYGRGDTPHNGTWDTPLHVAAGEGHVEIAALLLAHGADPYAPRPALRRHTPRLGPAPRAAGDSGPAGAADAGVSGRRRQSPASFGGAGRPRSVAYSAIDLSMASMVAFTKAWSAPRIQS